MLPRCYRHGKFYQRIKKARTTFRCPGFILLLPTAKTAPEVVHSQVRQTGFLSQSLPRLPWIDDMACRCRGPNVSAMYLFHWLNLCALNPHGTIEIRLHTSTLDPNKVTNWIKAHLRFVDCILAHDVAIPNDLQSQFELLCEIWDDESLAEFYAACAERFGTILHVPQYA